MTAAEVYAGSSGAATRALFEALQQRGAIGVVAVNLFRAQKSSARAKCYRGGIHGVGSYRRLAYERKDWSLRNLCEALKLHGTELEIRYGWKVDPQQAFHRWVLYVDLPQGQVSFHSSRRYEGPDYEGEWDGRRASAERVLAFCDAILGDADETKSLFDEEQNHESSCDGRRSSV